MKLITGMKRIKTSEEMRHLLLIVCLFAVCSCVEKYPTDLKNDLPFGLEYNMSESEARSVIDSLSKAGIIKMSGTDSNVFYYSLPCGDEDDCLSVTLQFYGDSLYKVDIRNNFLTEREIKENYNGAIRFFKEQGINMASYKREHLKYSDKYDYDYKKYPYAISLYNTKHSTIIVFTNEHMQKLIDREEKQALRAIKKDGSEFCKSIMDISTGIYKADITDAGFLVIGVKPIGEPNFDYLAQSYLEQALDAGVQVKGCLVVDVNNSTWKNGAVTGKRIGEAYK